MNSISNFSNRKRISITYPKLIKNFTDKKRKKNRISVQSWRKNFSRKEKGNNKERVDYLHRVACFDLQAPLPTPIENISTFYYKSKLLNYRFTVCGLQNKGLVKFTVIYRLLVVKEKEVPLKSDRVYCSTLIRWQFL